MREVSETKLPGVGVRHEFTTERGEMVGVLVHHDGRREILVYDRNDPDACSTVVKLTHDDARTLNELLGATQVSEEVQEAQQVVGSQSITWISIIEGSEADGTTLGAGDYAARSGATVVAVIRGDQPIPSPGPDFALAGKDQVVAVGSSDDLGQLRALLLQR